MNFLRSALLFVLYVLAALIFIGLVIVMISLLVDVALHGAA